jgi:hypothetical protein
VKGTPDNARRQRRTLFALRKAAAVAKDKARFRDGKGRDRVEASRKKANKKTKA